MACFYTDKISFASEFPLLNAQNEIFCPIPSGEQLSNLSVFCVFLWKIIRTERYNFKQTLELQNSEKGSR